MPPRFAFWTIILDNQPTAFRARERETLLPTLRQLQSKNPDAVMKWFARGRLWESPEEARRQRARARPQKDRRPFHKPRRFTSRTPRPPGGNRGKPPRRSE